MVYVEHISKKEKQTLTAYFKKAPNNLVRARTISIMMSYNGLDVTTIAENIGYHKNTIRDWVHAWNNERVSSIFPKYIRNDNAAKLTKKQKKEIKETLCAPDSLPDEFWSLPKLKNHISTTFGIEYKSERSYHYILKHSGLSWKLPTPFDIKRDNKLIEQRIKDIKKELKIYIKSDKWVVLTQDETRLNHDEEIKRAWLERGKKTVIRIERNKTGQSYFGALNQKSGKHHLIRLSWQDTENIIKALKKIKKIYPNKKVCILWDNARWHKSKALREQLKKGKSLERFHLINFPPYAPDTNPEEHVWKYGKESIRNQHFNTFEELLETFENNLKRKFDYKI